MILGIVLAGGRSRRMGRPKSTLPVDGVTFLERAVRTLDAGGCDEVVVVLNTDDLEHSRLTAGSGARAARGGGAGSEQIDSLRAGLRARPAGCEAAVVLPVDHPLVEPATVAALIGAFRARGAPIVQPGHDGKHGHPVLFASAVFDELERGELAEGARSVVHAHADALETVEVEDGGVLVDVNTPEDYRTQFGELP